MRCGVTTGTCAAAAARAAAEALLCAGAPSAVRIEVPAGGAVELDVEQVRVGADWAACTVRKDAGDDPDVTDNALIGARVEASACAQGAGAVSVSIDGGAGVGRVTRPGLDQPPGEAAINSVPRQMIEREVRAAALSAGFSGTLAVTVFAPEGEALAAQTFNPRLGIKGGISILGTSGIVRPMSTEALEASLELEFSVRRAAGARHVVVAFGNYGRAFAVEQLGVPEACCVQCSNFVGTAIDAAARLGFSSFLLVGHLGKMVKVAAGVMNTHSRQADARRETLAAHAALAGAARDVVLQIMESATTDAAADVLAEAGLLDAVCASLIDAVSRRLEARAVAGLETGAVMFSNARGSLSETPNALTLAHAACAEHRALAAAEGRR